MLFLSAAQQLPRTRREVWRAKWIHGVIAAWVRVLGRMQCSPAKIALQRCRAGNFLMRVSSAQADPEGGAERRPEAPWAFLPAPNEDTQLSGFSWTRVY